MLWMKAPVFDSFVLQVHFVLECRVQRIPALSHAHVVNVETLLLYILLLHLSEGTQCSFLRTPQFQSPV